MTLAEQSTCNGSGLLFVAEPWKQESLKVWEEDDNFDFSSEMKESFLIKAIHNIQPKLLGFPMIKDECNNVC